MHGVELACRDFGYSLMVCNTDNDPALEQHHLATLAAYQVEGLVINAAGQPGQALLESGVPVVLLDRDIHHLDAEVIGLDNALAIDMALAHLAQQGYRSILYVSETPEHTSTRQARLDRFQQQADAMGFTRQTLMLSPVTSTRPAPAWPRSWHRIRPAIVRCCAPMAMPRSPWRDASSSSTSRWARWG